MKIKVFHNLTSPIFNTHHNYVMEIIVDSSMLKNTQIPRASLEIDIENEIEIAIAIDFEIGIRVETENKNRMRMEIIKRKRCREVVKYRFEIKFWIPMKCTQIFWKDKMYSFSLQNKAQKEQRSKRIRTFIVIACQRCVVSLDEIKMLGFGFGLVRSDAWGKMGNSWKWKWKRKTKKEQEQKQYKISNP